MTSARHARRTEAGTAATAIVPPRASAVDTTACTALHVDWEPQIGILDIWLRKRYWGRGYSGERASALVRVAFERRDLEVVALPHDVDHTNSRRAISKSISGHSGRGEGTLHNQIAYADRVADAVRYPSTVEEYRRGRGSANETED